MTIRDILEAACATYHWGYREKYSGRGMAGTTCPAIVTERDEVDFGMDMVEFCQEEYPEKLKALLAVLRTTRKDNMGYDTVYYWPALEN